MNNVNFYLPDFYNNVNLICFLADLQKATPECFYEGARIASAYGAFPSSIWNGGRVFIDTCKKADIIRVIDALNSRGIAVRFTYTNPLIEEKHLNDTFCNLCLELADNKGNEVLVNSPILEEYIRKNYPKYTLISSTTKCLDKLDDIKAEMEKDYALVVIDSALNNTDELFALDHKDRMELIVDHFCEDNCPRRRAHYVVQGKAQLEFADPEWKPCMNIAREFFQIMSNRSFISTELLYGKYREAGFQHFKLDGRSYPPRRLIDSFLYYLVKPQWREKMATIIWREVYHT
ncbi:MAG: hypothetical protein J6Z22_03965 [Lachnospiraceae bacterium]|nr:hypothetical protein [Lachnospiraceae bacterium]